MPNVPLIDVSDELPTALYRLYAADVLLYVGITDSPRHRFKQHAMQKSWWAEVTRKTLQWHETRAEAEAAERAAIRSELPRYNLAGSIAPPPPPERPKVRFLPPGTKLADEIAVIDYIVELLESEECHAGVVILAAAALKLRGRLPRGAALAELADSCGVSKAMAYRILRKQDASDRLLHGVESHPWSRPELGQGDARAS